MLPRRRLYSICLAGFLLTLTIWCAKDNVPWQGWVSASPIECFWLHQDQQQTVLTDIADFQPVDKSIYFLETSCKSAAAGRLILGPRQACAIESAALHNPAFNVNVLFLAPAPIDLAKDVILAALQSYDNVKLLGANLQRMANGSGVEWLVHEDGPLHRSRYAVTHASDVVRYLLLWRYGGIYLDMDVVILRPLEGLGSNYAGLESEEDVAAGVMAFERLGRGHQLAEKCLANLKATFDGQRWGNNGPGVITRLARELCGHKLLCNTSVFSTWPPSAFYPVPYSKWEKYFQPAHQKEVDRAIAKSWAAHVWNDLSKHAAVGADAPYARLAQDHCPKVYAAAEVF